MYKLYQNSQVIVDQIEYADSFLKRLRGYMFYKQAPVKAIAFKPCNSIHTFFMRFDIDVLFLDHEMMVIKKIDHLQKRKMIPPVKYASYVLETPAGGFTNIKIGDIMSIC